MKNGKIPEYAPHTKSKLYFMIFTFHFSFKEL